MGITREVTMIKVGKNTTVSEKFTKLTAQYNELQKKIADLYVKLHTEEDGLICQNIRRIQDNLRKQQGALAPDIYREFYRMFDKKSIKICENNGREPKWFYIDNVAIKKRSKKEKPKLTDVCLGDNGYSVTVDACKCIRQNPSLGTDIRENAFPFSPYLVLGDSFRVTEIPKAEFDKMYKAAMTKEEELNIHKAAGYELYGFMPSEKLKASKEYKELANFVKTVKLRENLALLKIERLALKDNKKTKVEAAKGKKTKEMVAKAFDLMIEKVDKKIETKEKEIVKRCGEAK